MLTSAANIVWCFFKLHLHVRVIVINLTSPQNNYLQCMISNLNMERMTDFF